MCNRTYITLVIIPATILSWIPFVGSLAYLAILIWFGIKGNTWAWQNKKWESVEHFHDVQKKWAMAAVIFVSLACILVITMCIPIILNS